MRDMTSYELVGFTVTLIPKDSIIHQHEVDTNSGIWYVFPLGYFGMDNYANPLTDDEIKAGKHYVYGKFDHLYRTTDDLFRIQFTFIGNSFSTTVGGLDAEAMSLGREVFEDWEQKIIDIARAKLNGYIKPKNSLEQHLPVSFVTLWEYSNGFYSTYGEPDDYWSEWKLIGLVDDALINGLAEQIRGAQSGDQANA